MLDSFGCVSCFLLGIILCQDVNEAHEIHLLLRGPWGERPAMKSKYSPNSLSPGTRQLCFEKLNSLSSHHPGLCPPGTTLPTLKITRLFLTLSTPDGIDINEGFKLSRAQGPVGMDVAADTLRGSAIGAHQSRRSGQATVPIPL